MAQRLGRRWRQMVDAELRLCGLTASTWRVLHILGEQGDGARPKDIAEALSLERPSLAQLLDKLQREKLIERRDDPRDHRGKTVHMTDRGAHIHRQAKDEVQSITDRLTKNITEREFAIIKTVFDKIHRAIDLEDNRIKNT